jgi:hypothetical protein
VEPIHSGRSGPRSLCAAQGVLVALRRCSLDEAFIDIVQTAKRHNVAPLGLADALVAIAENDVSRYLDDDTMAAADHAWGALLSRPSADAAPGVHLPGSVASTQDGKASYEQVGS